jgi:ABC-type amino acid transport substrate-binding protein
MKCIPFYLLCILLSYLYNAYALAIPQKKLPATITQKSHGKKLTFVVHYPGSPPYIYKNSKEGNFVGIIPDLFKPLIKSGQFDIRYIQNNRTRSEYSLYKGLDDMALISKAWVEQPEKLLYSIPLLQSNSFLFKAEPFISDDFNTLFSTSKSVCTRRTYKYPGLEKYFLNNELIRIDSSSQATMLQMLFKKRCDFAVMNDFVALSLLNSALFKGKKLYRSRFPTYQAPLGLVFRLGLEKERDVINQHIKKLQQSGELEQIINFHIQHVFYTSPKNI